MKQTEKLYFDIDLEEAKLQNKIILDHCKKFKLKPCAISRDKHGHILLFVNSYEIENEILNGTLNCFMLGKNLITEKIIPYNIGYCNYKFYKDYEVKSLEEKQNLPFNLADIVRLSVHKAFNNLGIGRVILQQIENFVDANNIGSIELYSTKCYIPLNEKQNDTNSYYDKNLYFYTTCGYEIDKNPDRAVGKYSTMRPLKKSKVKSVIIDKGLAGPIKRVDKNAELFSIRSEYSYVRKQNSIYSYYSIFPEHSNTFPSEYFSPITLNTSPRSTLFLFKILKTHKLKEAFVASKSFLKTGAYIQYFDKNITFNDYCSTIEFKDFVNDKFQQYTLEGSHQTNYDCYLSQLKQSKTEIEEEPEA